MVWQCEFLILIIDLLSSVSRISQYMDNLATIYESLETCHCIEDVAILHWGI